MKPHEAKHRRRVPFIEQMQQTECGLCCMAMLMSYYKSSISLYDMREIAGSGRDGTTLKQLSNLANHLNFGANWYKVAHDRLHELDNPSILFWDDRHYVVLEKVTKSAFIIVDPAMGRQKLRNDQFIESYTGYLLAITPNENFKRKKAKSVWMPFIKILWEKPKLLASVLAVTIVLQILTLGVPMLIQRIIDGVIMPARENLLDIFLIGIILLVLFQTSFNFIKGKLLITLHNFLDHQMMTRFFKHILSLPFQFFQLRSFGDLLFRASSLRTIRNLLADQLIKGILDIGLLLIILVYMFSKSVLMTTWVVLISSLSALLVVLSRRLMTEVNQEEITRHTNLQGLQTEVFYGIFGIKTAGTEKATYHKWNQMFKELLAAYRKKETVLNYVNTADSALKLLAPLVVLWLGAKLVFGGSITLGVWLLFMRWRINSFLSLVQLCKQVTRSS
ncbi:cysteine peptidase family C39 domain-containing protein [Lentibacillus amyloliquefaciens]|uniref:cysteine peptidase family C39 domain-containing protein n=1 Tax=Lentibacillus amyloliquefaciens TaxID=1472767 RepID=UPI001F024532|nr:cysteine peptidase family C39 domain-containing protein [Lentibacillus amyloliquefaciens]